jgi:hypothetical protein
MPTDAEVGMATPEELRADIARARDELRGILRNVAKDWEKRPESGEGEEAWSARQAAEHVVRAEVNYARIINRTCAREGPEHPWPDAPPALPTPADALRALDEAASIADPAFALITAEDLQRPHERWGTVERVLAGNARHLREHAEQIRAATTS